MKSIYYGGFFLITLILAGCSGKREEKPGRKSVPVEIIQAEKNMLPDTRSYVGMVEEVTASSISFQVMGNVEQVLVQEGEKVQKGQLLSVLDKTTLENAYNASAASLRQTEDAYARMKTLYQNNSLPEMKWVEVESRLEQARSLEKISKKNLEDRNLYAPFSGVIGKRMVETGENVQPGQMVFSLLDIKTVHIKIAVPENEIASLSDQQAVIQVAALNKQEFQGKIGAKGIVANPISHTYEAKIQLENPLGILLPGMVCDVRLIGDNSLPAIALPNNAVLIDSDGSRFVWKVVNGKANAVPVRTGKLTEKGLLISEGLHEGDSIVIKGYQKISENMEVKAL